MSRPIRQTVDYFPHVVRHGKTIPILKAKFGNNGYAFWFQLLEILGDTEGHFYDILNPIDEEFLASKTGVSAPEMQEILKLLALCGSIDRDLLAVGTIWSQHFVDNLAEVYRKRKSNPPEKPQFPARKPELPPEIPPETPVIGAVITQRKEENRKEEKRKRTLCVYPEDFEIFWSKYPKHASKQGALAEWKQLNVTGLLPSLDTILPAIENQKRARLKAIDTGQFYPEWPDPERWLKRRRWEDEPETMAGEMKNGGASNEVNDDWLAHRKRMEEGVHARRGFQQGDSELDGFF